MVVGLLLVSSLVVNALLAAVAFGRFVYYDGPSSDRPDSVAFAVAVLAVGALELFVFAYAGVQALGGRGLPTGNVAFLALNSLLILLFVVYLERSSLRSATVRLTSRYQGS